MPLNPMLSLLNPVHNFTPYFLKPICTLSLHLSLCLGLQSYLTLSNFPTKIVYAFLFHPVWCVCSEHFTHDLIIWWTVQNMKLLLIMQSVNKVNLLAVQMCNWIQIKSVLCTYILTLYFSYLSGCEDKYCASFLRGPNKTFWLILIWWTTKHPSLLEVCTV